MLDKFGLNLLSYLNETSQNGEYIVLSFEDIKNKFKKNEVTNEVIKNTLDFLSNNDYIKIKFQDEEQICYCSLTKARIINETKIENKKDKKHASKLIILNIILSSISAFLGAFLAILLVHFFL